MTTGSNFEKNNTGASIQQEETIQAEIISAVPGGTDTGAPAPSKGQIVPSSSTEGSVWLRYTPYEPKMSDYDSSTNR